MLKTNSIGIFDSGLGGLTVVKAIMEKLPWESIVYFGDTAHLPYGDKSSETVKRLSLSAVRFLESHHVKMIVIACNSATATALKDVVDSTSLPVIGVVTPGAMEAVSVTKTYRIGVIGTKRTITSNTYKNEILSLYKEGQVFQLSTPLIVPLIEENWIEHRATQLIIKEYLDPFVHNNQIDTLVLGCTHYPLIKHKIAEFYPELSLVDSAVATSNCVKKVLLEKGLQQTDQTSPCYQFFVSDMNEHFESIGNRILEREVEIQLVEQDLVHFG